MTVLIRNELRDLTVEALINARTLAGNRVYAPRAWPTNDTSYPTILVQCYRDRKESRGRAKPPQFWGVTRISVIARVAYQTAQDAEAALDLVAEQMERAVLTSQAILRRITQVTYVETEMGVSSEGRNVIGQAQIDFGLEYVQDVDPYQDAPATSIPLATPITQIVPTIVFQE